MLSLASHEEAVLGRPQGQATVLRETAGGLRLDGRKYFVANAAESDFLLVSAALADTGETCLALVAPRAAGVELVRLHSLAHPDLYEIRFLDVSLAPEQLLGRHADLPARLAAAQERTAAFQSAAAVGGARRVLEMALDHARERVQFGKPIGSFQAVQHLLANAWSEVETAWLAAYEAITYLEAGLPGASDKVAIAKCASNDTFVRTCFTAHQVLGGMGYMWETDLHLWTRKAKEIELAQGGIYPCRQRLAASL
jgi:alkylation response protein AidB-like acyl-CoA dehydrogenase